MPSESVGDSIRTFIGIGIPEPQRSLLGTHVVRCSALAPRLRWVPPANLHLTLRFIGQTSPALLATIREGLQEVPFGPFEVGIGGAGTFGRGARTRVCWLGINRGQEPLSALAAAVESVCRQSGLRSESRPYNPHLTLARAREREGVDLPDLPASPTVPPWRVEEFSIYQSRLGKGGPTYTILETFSI